MRPSLPQNDTDPRRTTKLNRAREKYRFRHDYHGIVAADGLPLSEKTDVRYWAAIAKAMAELEINKLAMSTPVHQFEALADRVRSGIERLLPDELGAGRHHRARGHSTDAEGLHSYARMYQTIPAPPIVDMWMRDDIFAYQAVAGVNPVMLTQSTEALDHFPVTEAQYQRVVGGSDSLAAARAEGRIYLADYSILHGLPEGEIEGRKKFNFAPIAMYASTDRGLVAVAIQCGQRPGPSTPIFTPSDGPGWQMARTAVMTGEGNYQGIISHFALCHQIMESVILAAHRQLSERHPLLVLLEPHFSNTLITNDIAMSNLIGVDGYMERLQSPTLDASLGVANRAIANFRLTSSAPRLDFASRGVADPTALPDYPARDDALVTWDAILPWVDGYIRLYYDTDASVSADTELAAWVEEMGANDGGRLNGIDRPQTVAELVDLVAQIVFRCTVYHASINYSSFPLFSFPANVPTASFGAAPTGGASDTEAAWEAMLPPFDLACEALTLFYEITVRINRLGDYPRGHFRDERVAPLLAAHQSALEAAGEIIDKRNSTRLMPYPYMHPAQVSLSIHV